MKKYKIILRDLKINNNGRFINSSKTTETTCQIN